MPHSDCGTLSTAKYMHIEMLGGNMVLTTNENFNTHFLN